MAHGLTDSDTMFSVQQTPWHKLGKVVEHAPSIDMETTPRERGTRTSIKSRKASNVPGDTLQELTAAATDDSGRVWPRGTKFRPLAGGACGVATRYQEVTIIAGGAPRVRFLIRVRTMLAERQAQGKD